MSALISLSVLAELCIAMRKIPSQTGLSRYRGAVLAFCPLLHYESFHIIVTLRLPLSPPVFNLHPNRDMKANASLLFSSPEKESHRRKRLVRPPPHQPHPGTQKRPPTPQNAHRPRSTPALQKGWWREDAGAGVQPGGYDRRRTDGVLFGED